MFIKSLTYSIRNAWFLLARQQNINKKMVVSKEISDCFTKLVEPLVTTQRLEMFGKLKEGIIERSDNLKRESSKDLTT